MASAYRAAGARCQPFNSLKMPAAVASRRWESHAEGMAHPFAKFNPKRRWLQVSLRTVLVFVTLICVVLVWAIPGERQRRAVAALERFGGVSYSCPDDEATMESFPNLRWWLPPVYFEEVDSIELANTDATDAELLNLQALTHLQMLDLSGTRVTDVGMANLQGLTSLKELYLFNTEVTDAGLVHLQRLKSLKMLDLSNTHVTDAGIAKLRKALPKCKIILDRDRLSNALP